MSSAVGTGHADGTAQLYASSIYGATVFGMLMRPLP